MESPAGPNLVRQVLGGMDLRGLAPEDVYQLMSAGLNNKQIEAIEQYRKDSLEQQKTQHQDLMKEKGVDNLLAQKKFEADQKELKVGEAKTVGGKVVVPIYDKQGNLVRTDTLGDAPEKAQNMKLLKDGEGNPYWAKPGDQLRPGSTYLADSNNGFSINDQYTLSFLKSGVESGKDKDGNDMDEATRDNNMTLVNLNDKAHQFVKIPGKEVPGMFNSNIPPKYIKLPKDLAQLKALSDTSVVGYDPDYDTPITMAQVKETAKRTGQPVEMVFKYLGLIK